MKIQINNQIVSILAIALTLVSCKKEQGNTVDENPKIIREFFNQYEKYSAEKAVDLIFKSNQWIRAIDKNKKDSISNDLSEIVRHIGKYHNYEVIKSTAVGNSYKVVSCLAKHERQPVRFNFVLYKPSQEWQIQNFTYDFNIEEELLNTTNLTYAY